jgi:hypothetical protein
LAQTILVALLLGAQILPQPRISSGILAENGLQYGVPLIVFLVLALSLAAGYWLALAGALRMHWSVRFLVTVLVTGILAFNPITVLVNNPGTTAGPYITELWLRRAQLGALALFWIWSLGETLARRYKRRESSESPAPQPWHWQAFVGVLALLLVYYGLEFGVELAFIRAGLAETGTSFLLGSIGLQVIFLPEFFVLLFLWYSTDLLDWGQILARGFLTLWSTPNRPDSRGILTRCLTFIKQYVRFFPLLLVLTTLTAVGMIVNELRQAGTGLISGLVIVAVLAGIVALLVRFARVDASWPKEITSMWLLYGATFIFIEVTLLYNVTYDAATTWGGLAPQAVGSLYELLQVPIALITLTVALFLVVQSRRGKPGQGAVGLFLVMLVLLVFILELSSALTNTSFSLFRPRYLLGSLMVCAALGTLAWMLRALAQGSLKEKTPTLAIVLLMLVGLQTIDWVSDLLHAITQAGALSPFFLAGLFLLLGFWSFFTSGEQVTNVADKPSFPREGRVLLFAGYTLVANALLLYLGTLRAPVTGSGPASYLNSDLTASTGLLLLGPAIVVLGFILKRGQSVPHRVNAAPASQLTRPVSRMQLGVIGSGVLLTALVLAFIVTDALPQIVHSNTLLEMGPYKAAVPGPGCDSGTANSSAVPIADSSATAVRPIASWSVTAGGPISTQCLSTGLQITDNPQATGRVVFSLTPSPQNYSISVHINFTGFNGCGGIETRFTSSGDYINNVCSNGAWFIDRFDHQENPLIGGQVAPATAYTIEAASDGANQRFSINGVQVGSVSDSVFSGGTATLELHNLSSAKQSAVFSDFIFTPLPVPSPISPQSIYRASTPGANCDKGGAQWASIYPRAAARQCQANGLWVGVPAKGLGLVAFTPPVGIFPQNYRIAIQVAFDNPSDCAAIETRALSADNYANLLCGDGNWSIGRNSQSQHIFLASGVVTPARTYTIEATVDGSNQRFAVNGVQIGTVLDTTFSATGFINLVTFNSRGNAGTIILSNFVFTPLPTSPLISSPATYRAVTPGPGCDQGGGQWALMDPIPGTTVRCLPAGMRFETPAHSTGEEIGFTPPGGAVLPNNYRVAVQVDVSSMRDSCVAVGVRASAEKDYAYGICSNSVWEIGLLNKGTFSIFTSGKVAPANVYTLAGTIDGSKLSFAINGVEVGSVSNSVLTINAFSGFGFANNSNSNETVVFSNFVFTPLP